MKWLPVVIVIALLATAGYVFRADLEKLVQSQAPAAKTEPAARAIPSAASAPPEPLAAAPPKPALKLEPGKFFAPAGVFYMTERVSVVTDAGVAALEIADKVTLVAKLPGNKLKVTNGKDTLVIKDTQATNDLVLARQAEEKDFVAHGGKL